MHEVETTIICKLLRERMIRDRPLYRIPAHMGDTQPSRVRKSSGVSANQAEAWQVAFLAVDGQHLHADAYAKHRSLRRSEFQYRISQARTVQGMHASIKGAYSRQDQAIRVFHRFLAGYDFRFDAKLAEHIAYRSGIADTVIDDAYFGHGAPPVSRRRLRPERSLTNPADAKASTGMNTRPK